jgi:hypothetical protein
MRPTLEAFGALVLLIEVVACRQRADATHESRSTPSSLTAEQCEVIRVAERFVEANGYTKAPATPDRSRIEWELLDDPSKPDRVLEIRHDTLQPHAYGLRPGVPGDPLAWTVLFEYTDRVISFVKTVEGKPREEADGAVVRVKLAPGEPPRAIKQHTPILLSGVTQLPPSAEVASICADVEKKH